jgi:hypothetical protein
MLSFNEFLEEDLDEAVKRKVVVRGGKRKVKFKTNRDGYKVVGKKEIRISPTDAKKMSIRNTKSARKRNMVKRTGLG